MKLKRFYLNSKKPLYVKMFAAYGTIVLCIVGVLTLFFLSDSRKRMLEENREMVGQISADALAYIEETGRGADYIHKDLYRSPSELADLLEYLRLATKGYEEYALQRYIASPDLVYKGMFRFLNEAFEAHGQLEKIELISYQTFQLTEFYPENQVYPGKSGRMRMKQIQDNTFSKEGKLVYLKEIRHPDTMKPAGCMLFEFEAQKAFADLLKRSPYARMTVANTQGQVIFQSKGGADYTRAGWGKSFFSCTESSRGHQIYAFMDEREASRLPAGRLLLGLFVQAAVSALGICLIHCYVKRLTGRVDVILDAMNRVTTGDFQVRLAAGRKKDELDMIAENFNRMCEKLELYIAKSYLEEIERKNAQMQALQSQINPHFLYNTLEAIRMKAICNGDRDVGKMLYSMVVLFRSQLKEADMITLGQELDYCKQYLELFAYRYGDSFHSKVECPPDLLDLRVIKFALQPIVENYFIHGIDRDRKDNLVQIRARREDGTLFLYVQDNGCGMEPELLEQKNTQLRENRMPKSHTGSVGIENVNRRIKAVYGSAYGITLKAADPHGLTVILRMKAETEPGKETV